MKKKYKLKEWVKNTLVIILIEAIMFGGLLLMDFRFKQLCNNGYTRYCFVEE